MSLGGSGPPVDGSAGAVSITATGPPNSQHVSRRDSWVWRFLSYLHVSNWRRVPLPLVLLAVWGGLRWYGIFLPTNSLLGLALIVTCFIVLVLEFYKSGDISLPSFKLDQFLSVLATVSVSVIATLLWEHKTFFVVDFFVVAVVLVDAYLSPVNSFRTALRNLQAGFNNNPGGDPHE